MKIATNRYAVKITKDGKTSWDGYYGYKTRKEAEIRAGLWEKEARLSQFDEIDYAISFLGIYDKDILARIYGVNLNEKYDNSKISSVEEEYYLGNIVFRIIKNLKNIYTGLDGKPFLKSAKTLERIKR